MKIVVGVCKKGNVIGLRGNWAEIGVVYGGFCGRWYCYLEGGWFLII